MDFHSGWDRIELQGSSLYLGGILKLVEVQCVSGK